MTGWRRSLDDVLANEPDPDRDRVGAAPRRRLEVPRCSLCGFPREPLLEFEMEPGGRAETELCRSCFEDAR